MQKYMKSIRATADALELHEDNVRALISAGLLKAVTLGEHGRQYVSVAEIARFEAEHKA